MNPQDVIKKLRSMPTDIEGHVAVSYAIEAVLQQDREYCPWCDQNEEGYEVRVGLWAEKYGGMEPYDKPDIEFKFCPICNRKMKW